MSGLEDLCVRDLKDIEEAQAFLSRLTPGDYLIERKKFISLYDSTSLHRHIADTYLVIKEGEICLGLGQRGANCWIPRGYQGIALIVIPGGLEHRIGTFKTATCLEIRKRLVLKGFLEQFKKYLKNRKF